MIIDATYFIGKIAIGQISTPEVLENVQHCIAVNEPAILADILGKQMYREFVEGLEQETPEQRWIDLRDGVEWEWMGFANELKQSIVANFVFVKYQEEQFLQAGGIGIVKPKAENANMAPIESKIVPIWNEMIDWICKLHDFLISRPEDYPDYQYKDRKSICKSCQCGCCDSKPPFRYINSLNL